MDDAISFGSALTWLGDVGRRWGRWVRTHLGMTILLGIAAFVVGWVWNTYLLAVELDGSNPGPGTETIATADGKPFNNVFWLLAFGLLSGLITYGRQRGLRNMFGDLAVLPRKFGQTMSQNARGSFAMLLWGMAVSLLVSIFIPSAVSLALALVLLILAATPLGTIINSALIKIWKALTGNDAPSEKMGAVLVAGPFLVMLGEASGLLLDWLFASLVLGLILGVGAAVGSVLLGRGASPSPTTTVGVLIGLSFALAELWPGRALADDGGWKECHTPDGVACSDLGPGGLYAWCSSEGAGALIASGAMGGGFAGLGAAIGIGLGAVAAGLAMGG